MHDAGSSRMAAFCQHVGSNATSIEAELQQWQQQHPNSLQCDCDRSRSHPQA